MKNLLKNLSSVLFVVIIFFTSVSIEARFDPTYYIMPDECDQYFPGCEQVVVKCSLTGVLECEASMQTLCEDSCEDIND